MSRGRLLLIALGVLSMIGVGVGAAVLSSGARETETTNTAAACVDEWFGDCLSKELEVLAKSDPQAALAEYETQAQANGRVREVCHLLFHMIGQGATQSDREPWEVFMLGSSECNWGYVHGAVEGYLRGSLQEVINEAGELCTIPEGTEGDASYINSVQGNCIHGTGHALFHANEDPIEAELGCRAAFEDKQTALNCIDGVIMEYGNSDAAKQGKHADLCQVIGEDARETCYRNVALTWYYQSNGEYLKVLNQCREAESSGLVFTCTWGAGNLFTVQTGFDLGFIDDLCQQLKEEYARGCYTGAAVAGALGVNTGVLEKNELDDFLAGAGDPSWRDGILSEIEKAEGGFGESAAS